MITVTNHLLAEGGFKGEILKWKATYRAELPCVAVDSVPQKVALISESVGEI